MTHFIHFQLEESKVSYKHESTTFSNYVYLFVDKTGIGIAMLVVTTYFCLYYNLLITYILYYMYWSFWNPLPWTGCDNPWNTENCYESLTRSHSNLTVAEYNETTTTEIMVTEVSMVTGDFNTTINGTEDKRVRASEEFWRYDEQGIPVFEIGQRKKQNKTKTPCFSGDQTSQYFEKNSTYLTKHAWFT